MGRSGFEAVEKRVSAMENGREPAMRQMKLTTVPYPRSTGATGGQVVVCPSTFVTD